MTDVVTVKSAAAVHRGARDVVEDKTLVRDDLWTYVIADGAGTHGSGAVAAEIAIEEIENHFLFTKPDKQEFDALGLPYAARRLSSAVHRANRAVIGTARAAERYHSMGTTVVACHVEPEVARLHLAWVGDSRCYRVRRGHTELLTQDHTLVGDVLEMTPDISEEKLAALPARVVTRALGMDPVVRVSVTSHAILPGDRFVMCSDGLVDGLLYESLMSALAEPMSPKELLEYLADLVDAENAADNVAIVVLEFGGRRSYAPPVLRYPPVRTLDVGQEPEMVMVETHFDDDLDEVDTEEFDEDDENPSFAEARATGDVTTPVDSIELAEQLFEDLEESDEPPTRIASARFKRPKSMGVEPRNPIIRPRKPYVPPTPNVTRPRSVIEENDAPTRKFPSIHVRPAGRSSPPDLKVLLKESRQAFAMEKSVPSRSECPVCKHSYDLRMDECPRCARGRR